MRPALPRFHQKHRRAVACHEGAHRRYCLRATALGIQQSSPPELVAASVFDGDIDQEAVWRRVIRVGAYREILLCDGAACKLSRHLSSRVGGLGYYEHSRCIRVEPVARGGLRDAVVRRPVEDRAAAPPPAR
eukprot:2875684-Prymnesium_polylepis.1